MNKDFLGDIGEPGILNLIQKWIGGSQPPPSFNKSRLELVLGVKDDCVALKLVGGEGNYDRKTSASVYLLTSVDLLIEGVHFRREYFSYQELGYKVLAVNISDIAAMGGMPGQALIGLALPKEMEIRSLEEFYNSLVMTAKDYGIQIIGGDTVRSPGPLMISVTILGTVERQNMISRKGAQPGDKIMVTGDLGRAMLGFRILERSLSNKCTGLENGLKGGLCDRFLHPVPRIQEARILAKNHLATSMIDLSDSLSQGLDYLCRASGVGAKIIKADIPVAPEAKGVFAQWDEDPYNYALSGGEDYELLFTVKHEEGERVKKLLYTEAGSTVSEIGEILPIEACLTTPLQRDDNIINFSSNVFIVDERGSICTLTPKGFEHFNHDNPD